MEYTIKHIIDILPKDYELLGNLSLDIKINNIKPAQSSNEHSLVFISSNREDKQQLAVDTVAKVIICDKEIELTSFMQDKVLIKVDKPKYTFAVIANQLFIVKPKPEIHPSAIIHPEAYIDPSATIGPHSFIGKVKIGANSQVHGNVHLYDNTIIGQNVILKAGCVIGSHGYGYVRDENHLPIKFPHVGRVVIEDEVEIGCNSCIDLGSLGDTIIGYGSKIDNLVHIGHNVQIGKCVYVAAQTSISGSSVIGDYTEIWTGVGIADYSKIGERASVGIGSVVIKEVPERKKCFGNPARVFADNI